MALPFARLETPVKITFGENDSNGNPIEFDLQYPIIVLRRLRDILGMPMLGRKGSLMDVDESVLPELILQGICDPETGVPPARVPGGDEPVTLDFIIRLPSSAMPYLAEQFRLAYTQSQPQKKMTDVIAAMANLATPEAKNPTQI